MDTPTGATVQGNSCRIPYLVVLTSSNQLYSGTGTSLFEWIRYSKHRFDYTILIDNTETHNYVIARDFCREHGLGFMSSGPARRRGAADPGVAAALDTAPPAGDVSAAASQAFDFRRTLGQKLHRIEVLIAERCGGNVAAAPV